jgi:hypothetical protein
MGGHGAGKHKSDHTAEIGMSIVPCWLMELFRIWS